MADHGAPRGWRGPGWTPPPAPARGDGAARRVGVEIEFAGLDPRAAAGAVATLFGGVPRAEGPHRLLVEGGRWGPFAVELDMALARRKAGGAAEAALRDLVLDIAALAVPVEIVCPPIPWDEAHELDALCAELARLGAVGTRNGLLYAFGLQLNIEPPALDAPALLAGLRAFLLLRDWLRAEIMVDTARDLWRFAAPFPEPWIAATLDPAYAPDLCGLIDGYLADNPTRDRELDALPLLAWLDEARVRAVLPREKIKPRPAWHYRLPNSEVGATGWGPGREWARWVLVERLAADPVRLRAASLAWLSNHDSIAPQDWTAAATALAAAMADAP